MKAVFLDMATLGPDGIDVAPLRDLTPEFNAYDNTTDGEVAARIRDCDFVYVNKVRIGRDAIESAGALRFIGLAATGVDNVDIAAARDRGVAVCNIRAYCTSSVAEHVFAVLLHLTRSIGRYRASVRAGDWQKADSFCMLDHPIRELSAMTLGIVGLGELGGRVARLAKAFGMRVMVARRPGQTDSGEGRSSFDTLMKSCDVVSLHCPLTPATEGLIGRRELALMKKDAILVNTARGGLVDADALVDALARGAIGGAAIDVLSQEPPVAGNPLLDYTGDNLIVTPHIAWASIEGRQSALNEIAANVRAFLDGEQRNRIV